MKINLNRRNALIICCLPIIALIVSHFTKNYRYSEYRNIYLFGVATVYTLWFSSFLWGILNAILIWRKETQKVIRIIWFLISLLPIIYMIVGLIIAIITDY